MAEFIVLNLELDSGILDKISANIRIIKIENFKPCPDFYFFGFINPNKQPLLEILTNYKLVYSICWSAR